MGPRATWSSFGRFLGGQESGDTFVGRKETLGVPFARRVPSVPPRERGTAYPSGMNLSPIPGCPDDVGALLARHWDRVLLNARRLQRDVADPSAFILVFAVDDFVDERPRNLQIARAARSDAPRLPFAEELAHFVNGPAPDGFVHMLVLTSSRPYHTLVPLPSSVAALH